MKVAKTGRRVRCDSYMSPGWSIAWFKDAKGFFCVNPRTGGNYLFRPEMRDEYGRWSILS